MQYKDLRDFIAQYADNPDHPLLQDFFVVMRGHAPDPAAFDAFVGQWYESVVVPEYRLSDARRTRLADGTYETRVRVQNIGSASMPVEVAVARGERFPKAKAAGKTLYRDARMSVVLGKGVARVVTLRSAFEPERVLMDPDVRVLQLNRKVAEVKL